jgi:hypothetical protein
LAVVDPFCDWPLQPDCLGLPCATRGLLEFIKDPLDPRPLGVEEAVNGRRERMRSPKLHLLVWPGTGPFDDAACL